LSEKIDSEGSIVKVSEVVETPDYKKEVVDSTREILEEQSVFIHIEIDKLTM